MSEEIIEESTAQVTHTSQNFQVFDQRASQLCKTHNSYFSVLTILVDSQNVPLSIAFEPWSPLALRSNVVNVANDKRDESDDEFVTKPSLQEIFNFKDDRDGYIELRVCYFKALIFNR